MVHLVEAPAKQLSRRQFIGACAIGVGGSLSRTGSLRAESKDPLRRIAARKGYQIGALANAGMLSNGQYSQTLATEFNAALSEDLHWREVHPEQNLYSFADADQEVEFAQAHQMRIQGHHLAWGNPDTLPAWLLDGGFSPDEVLSLLRDHIRHLVGHFKSKVQTWTVVNEPFEADGSYKTDPSRWSWWNINSPWSDGVDPDYIELAFREAHNADPKAVLLLNEWGAEEWNPKSDAVYALVGRLLNKGVPIHGIGMQMHLHVGRPLNRDSVVANMQRINTDLGVDVFITEFTVSLFGFEGTDYEGYQAQADIYRDMFSALSESRAGNSFTIFGVNDESWATDEGGNPDPQMTIFDYAYNKKPAYFALQEELEKLPDK